MGKPLGAVGLARIISLVLGVVVMGVGLHSHFQSDWVKKADSGSAGLGSVSLHEICSDGGKEVIKQYLDKSCPSISLERYFVAMIIICFIVSLILLIASFVTDLSTSPLKLVDLGYHVVAAILLLIAAIVYLISTEQINGIYTAVEEQWNVIAPIIGLPPGLGLDVLDIKLLRGEKLAAGAITILQALLYGVVAVLIGKQSS